ncbi:MAG: hypothetical protein ACI4F7_01365 [Acutalibacteraceae bacterium]
MLYSIKQPGVWSVDTMNKYISNVFEFTDIKYVDTVLMQHSITA